MSTSLSLPVLSDLVVETLHPLSPTSSKHVPNRVTKPNLAIIAHSSSATLDSSQPLCSGTTPRRLRSHLEIRSAQRRGSSVFRSGSNWSTPLQYKPKWPKKERRKGGLLADRPMYR